MIREQGDALYRQCVPDCQETASQNGYEDPLDEEWALTYV